MIKFQLNKKVVALFTAVTMFGAFSASSSAALIDPGSELALFGTYTPDNADLSLATSLSFGSPAVIAAGANDFAFLTGASAFFNTFSIDISSPTTIFTFGNIPTAFSGVPTGSFTASSINVDELTATALNLTMQGFWSLDGFDDTQGQLVLTADSLAGLFTFSASGTVQPIPVPAAVWLFASALAGLGLTRRRKA